MVKVEIVRLLNVLVLLIFSTYTAHSCVICSEHLLSKLLLKSGRVELGEISFQIYWAVSVYYCTTAQLIIACSSASQRHETITWYTENIACVWEMVDVSWVGCRTEGGLWTTWCDLTTMSEEHLLVMQCAKVITADVSQEVNICWCICMYKPGFV